MARVAIIIVNWNGYTYTRNCLLSLNNVSFKDKDIYIVDNGSTDDSVVLLKNEFPDIRLFTLEENKGFTGGNNVGISAALKEKAEYVLLLNNDTEVAPDFLEHLLDVLDQKRDVAAVQPIMYYMNDKGIIWNAGGKFNRWVGTTTSVGLGKKNTAQYQVFGYTDWITGCCLLVRASVIEKIGLLDDRYFAYWEDVDWSLRMRKAGWKLWYQPSSMIYHWAGVSSTAKQKGKEGFLSPNAILWEVRNHIFIVKAHGKLPQVVIWWLYQLGKWILFAGYFVLRRRWTKLSMVFRGIREGLTA